MIKLKNERLKSEIETQKQQNSNLKQKLAEAERSMDFVLRKHNEQRNAAQRAKENEKMEFEKRLEIKIVEQKRTQILSFAHLPKSGASPKGSFPASKSRTSAAANLVKSGFETNVSASGISMAALRL